jgi:transposase
MNEITTIGLDLAKNVFYVHGVDARGKTVVKKKLVRAKVLEFFANLQPCLVGMEAGGGSNYWAREIKKLGHDTKVMAAQFVKPFNKSNKNDENDAEAICEAVTRPSMRFVPVKSVDQQDIQSVHRIRERLVTARSSLACEIRGLLGEYGIAIPQGIRELPKTIPEILSDEDNLLTSFTRELIQDLFAELLSLTEKVKCYNARIELIHKNHPVAQRLTTIPGVGPIAATAILANASDPSMFKNGREFAAYFGLVPRQSSSGGKQNLLGISKRGDKYIRTMLVHGARAAVGHNKNLKGESQRRLEWVQKLRERKGYNKTAVALANKNARTIWALLKSGESFKAAA